MSEIWNLSTLCRCCHADGHFMSLNSSYQHTGTNDVEIYDTMLRDTLGIFISNQLVSLEVSYTICDSCIIKLRNATKFKNQVLMCEEKLKLYCNSQEIDDNWIDDESEDVKKDQEIDDNWVDDQSEDVKKECYIEFDDIKLPPEEIKKGQEIDDNWIGDQSKDVKKENIPKTEIEEIRNEPERKQKSERIPKKKLKNKDNINGQKLTKNKKQRVNLDRSFIIQVYTNSGSQFSCKDCGGLYQTEKDINKHIFKEHAALLKCDVCSKELKSFETLKNHLKLHTEKEFDCRYCSKKFASKKAVGDHQKCHTTEHIYKCDLCKKDFKYKQSLIRHLRVHAGTNKKILCDVCGWSFNDRSNLNAHIRAVHEKLRPFHCKICQKTYTNQRHLRDHLKVHNDDKNLYKCNVCDRRLSCPKTMQIHRLKHDNKFMCRHCSKIFDDATSKIEHVKAVHSKAPPWFTCPLCGKIYSGKYSLNRHIDEHNGIKKFSCNLCGLKFTQKVVLNRHILRKHNPEADIDIEKTKCDICKRSYKNIVLHMDKHRKRLCTCEMCGKAYWNRSALNRHKSLKHFDKSYNCTICEKKYLKKSSLNAHKKKVHQIKIEKRCE